MIIDRLLRLVQAALRDAAGDPWSPPAGGAFWRRSRRTYGTEVRRGERRRAAALRNRGARAEAREVRRFVRHPLDVYDPSPPIRPVSVAAARVAVVRAIEKHFAGRAVETDAPPFDVWRFV